MVRIIRLTKPNKDFISIVSEKSERVAPTPATQFAEKIDVGRKQTLLELNERFLKDPNKLQRSDSILNSVVESILYQAEEWDW